MSLGDFFAIITYGLCFGFGLATALFILSAMLGLVLSFLRKY